MSYSTLKPRRTYVVFRPVKVSNALIAFSSRYFIVFSSRSVHAASSISCPFVFGAVEEDDDGKGNTYSAMTCSTTPLGLNSSNDPRHDLAGALT
jgi:hypothetical protein